MKKAILVAAGLLSTGLLATAASAAPLGGIGGTTGPSDSGIVQKIHDGNTHRACLLGPGGWHYHTRFTHRRVSCRPVSPGKLWIWRSEGGKTGWWHRNERRWHD